MEWARGMKQPHRESAEKQTKTKAKLAFILFIPIPPMMIVQRVATSAA
jgi:hypothetical protein